MGLSLSGKRRIHDLSKIHDGSLEVVVDDDVVEIIRLFHLMAGDLEALADVAGRLGRALAQAPLELGERRSGDEDGDALGHLLLDGTGAARLELENATSSFAEDALDLGSQRPVPVTDVDDVLEELTLVDAADELLLAQEVVLAPVLFTGTSVRVVADTATSRSARRSTSARINVPLPAPDGPVTTKSRGARSAAKQPHQFGALAVAEAAHRL